VGEAGRVAPARTSVVVRRPISGNVPDGADRVRSEWRQAVVACHSRDGHIIRYSLGGKANTGLAACFQVALDKGVPSLVVQESN
jgi:hypothetical protein